MRVVIVGAGAVGFHLVHELAAEGHGVSLLDQDPALLERVRDRLDVLSVHGSATARAALEAAGAAEADLFIAVTGDDEVNLVSCAAASTLGARHTLARVRNPDLGGAEPLVDLHGMGITRCINPDEVAADSIAALVDAPGSVDVADFAGGRILLRSFDVEEDSPVARRPLERLREAYPGEPLLVVSVERDGAPLEPCADVQLVPGDRAYVILAREALPLYRRLVAGDEQVQRLVVYGASRFGVRVCERLQDRGTVLLIDEDAALCEAAAARLLHTVVLHGSPNDADIQAQARLSTVDVFVAAGSNEEHSLILALLAKQRGARRNIVVTADPDITALLDSLDIDAVINPRLTMAGRILRFAREERVTSVQKLAHSSAEVVELVVRGGARVTSRTLERLRLPAGVRVGAVMRREEVFIPTGGSRLEEGDIAVIFVAPGMRRVVERLFSRRGRLRFADGARAPAEPPLG